LIYDSSDGGAENYLIWQPLSEQNFMVREFPDDKITIVVK
jgi:hypothetical protein